MRYVLKKRLLSLAESFVVRDQSGAEVLAIDGRVFSLRGQLIFRDMSGNELAMVEKKLLSFGPTYEIYHGGKLRAVVKEALFTLVGHRFSITDEEGGGELEAKGNFTNHEYTFTRGGQEVARVSESWFSITDTYGVDVIDGQDDVLILACAVVIERCQEESHKQRL